jgi:hypothetical protein
VADVGVVRIVVAEREALDLADVQVVGLAGAAAIVAELGVFDHDVAVRVGVGQDTVLVVVYERMTQREVGTLQAESGAVGVHHLGADHLDIVHGQVVAVDHPDTLVGGILSSRVDPRAAVDAADGQVVAVDAAGVATVGPVTRNLDEVAITGRGDGRARCAEGLAGADGQCRGGGVADDGGGQRHGRDRGAKDVLAMHGLEHSMLFLFQ